MKFIFKRIDEQYVVAKVANGRFDSFRVYGLPDAYCGCPGVVIVGDISNEALTLDQAEELAVGLVRAVQAARGSVPPAAPTPDVGDNVVVLR